MKRILIILALVFTISLFVVAPVLADVIGIQVNDPDKFDLWSWLKDNWAVVALVFSEFAALLPSKVSGIVHLLITITSKVLKIKN